MHVYFAIPGSCVHIIHLHVLFLVSYCIDCRGPVAQWVRSLNLTAHTSLSPIRRGFAPSFLNDKKGCTQLAAASDKDYQLVAQGRWFSPASSTTKTGRHDIAEILLKVALNTKNSNSNALYWLSLISIGIFPLWWMKNKMKNQKIPHCRNSSKSSTKIEERQNRYN